MIDPSIIYLISIPSIFMPGLVIIGYFWPDKDAEDTVVPLFMISFAWWAIVPAAILYYIGYGFFKFGIILKNSLQKLKEIE